MGRGRLLITRRARLDLEELADYIAHDDLNAALRFIDAVEQTCARLAESPEMGSEHSFKHESLAGVRSFTVSGFPNYVIFYRPASNDCEVIRILHGARDIDRTMDDT